jgi:hypothetical protein
MNVLFFTSWYPNKFSLTDGIFIKEHAKCIKNAGLNIVVLAVISARSNSLFKKEVEVFTDENDLETHIIYLKSRFYKWIYINVPLQSFFAYRYYKKNIANRFPPDFIHSHIIYPAGLIGHRISRKLNKPHIITEHW